MLGPEDPQVGGLVRPREDYLYSILVRVRRQRQRHGIGTEHTVEPNEPVALSSLAASHVTNNPDTFRRDARNRRRCEDVRLGLIAASIMFERVRRRAGGRRPLLLSLLLTLAHQARHAFNTE